jgi:hypothetical protein
MHDSHDDWIDEMLGVIVFPLAFIMAALVLSGIGAMIFQHGYRFGIICLLGAGVCYVLMQGIIRYKDLKENKHG